MHHLVELNGGLESDRRQPIFDALRDGVIVVYRDLPEIHRLGETIFSQAAKDCDSRRAEDIAPLFRSAAAPDLLALAAVYRAIRSLRDARYLSCLFSDLIDSLDLPKPILVDAGFFRMMLPRSLSAEAFGHPDLFDPDEFKPHHPNEFEQVLQDGRFWGNAHRDIDVRHSHFQVNLWFPLHDLKQKRSLLLFPDAYHRDVLQYTELRDPDAPSEWGYGNALQIPLKFGDVIAFQSQQLHASPSQGPAESRFTVELRLASGCIDDNSRIYRRTFWGLHNFLPDGVGPEAAVRAQQLAEPRPLLLDIDHIIAGRSAHAVVNALFRTPDASMKAGYARRPEEIFDDAFFLDLTDWSRVLKRLYELPCDEDLLLLVARLLLRQGYQIQGMALLRRICNRTQSHFWALEVGYFAAANKDRQLAEIAFKKAGQLAAGSGVKLDRYVAGMPPSRSAGLLQLLPETAVQISQAFASWLAADDLADAAKFDHRLYWDKPPVATSPRSGPTTGRLKVIDSLDMPPTLIKSHGGYNIVQRGSDLIAVDQGLGSIRLFEETIGERAIGSIILRGGSVDELINKIESAVGVGESAAPARCASPPTVMRTARAAIRDILDTLGLLEPVRKIVNVASSRAKPPAAPAGPVATGEQNTSQAAAAAAPRPAKAHMDEDFLQYAFHDDPAAIAIALANSLGNGCELIRLIGSSALVDDLCKVLETHGHKVERVRWSFADPVPAAGFGTGILCDVPKTFDEWRACAVIIGDGGVQPIWHRVLSYSLLREMLAQYEYNAGTLAELLKVYRGHAPETIGRRSTGQLDRIEQYFPLRGKTIIEFGPSDGNRTADLIASGPAHVLAVEGRPENVIKMLVAKQVMGWQNLSIAFDNFQLPGSWANSRYDFAYAQGVYYHCQNPLLFLDLLTRLSDTIFIGGWAASDVKPPTPWLELEQGGVKYRGKVYTESFHFLSGLARQSYMLKSTEIERFLAGRGFVTKYCDVTIVNDNLGTDWIDLLAMRA